MTREEFQALPKNEQRVAIAKDVMERIGSGKFHPRTNYYLNLHGVTYGQLEEIDELQQVLEQAPRCDVCALGAAFCSYILINDSFPANPGNFRAASIGFEDTEVLTLRTDSNGVVDEFAAPLASLFGRQMDLIEAAFERSWGCGLHIHKDEIDSDEIEAAVEFGNMFHDHRERLLAIMENIIENEGNFIPGVKLVV